MRIKSINLLLFVGALILSTITQAQDVAEEINIIPQPVSVERGTGYFQLTENTKITYTADSLRSLAEVFREDIHRSTGFDLRIEKASKQKKNTIFLALDEAIDLPDYELTVNPKGVKITGNWVAGLRYGIQSLKQLFPAEIESKEVVNDIDWKAPSVEIKDRPQFAWRGMMLDVSRHFFSVDEIKAYIDQLEKYKFNVFHWHLVDDQGWRIEIKGYPKLTEVGAWREKPEVNENEGKFKDGKYGGYYTQEDIKDVVAYAQKRGIEVLPEIEMPGHSQAAVAAYPELGCTNEPVEVWNRYGVSENVLCPNEETFQFLETVVDQIVALFPSSYLHIGGDETPKKQWANSEIAQEIIKREGLKDEEELQSYFMTRMSDYIRAKGKRIIGWDEMLEGGLPPKSIVMSWRGVNGGIEATKQMHPAIFAPYGRTYISQVQGDPAGEPRGPMARTRLKATFETDLYPEGVEKDLILGGEAALWTEWVPNFRHAEYMTWPRGMAAAEVFWGTATDWNDFAKRAEAHFKRLDAADVKYATSLYDPIVRVDKEGEQLKVKLDTEIEGLTIYYTFDGTDPDHHYPKYQGKALTVPKTAPGIRMITYRDGQPIGRQMNISLEELKNRVPKK